MRIHISILFLITTFLSDAQKHEIVGFAPELVGEKVTLYTYQDYVTMTRINLGEATVNPEDSLFHLPLETSGTFNAVLEVGNVEASLYIAPQTSYEMYFPKPKDQPLTFKNQLTQVLFYGLDSTDINYRILQYNQWFDAFVAYHEVEIARGQFSTYLDTFMVYVSDAYKEIKDEYFITYVRYNIAEMQQTFGGNNQSNKRLETFLSYIEPFPVYYENDQYMKFFKGFYNRKFEDFPPTVEAYINVAIEKASPTALMAALKQDLFLANPEIREMVMIDKLGKHFYQRPDQKRSVLVMLDSIHNHARYAINATIAKNVMNYLTTMEVGFPAPPIELTDPQDSTEVISLGQYRGKFLYLNFFETWNDQANADMRVMIELQKKYGEYVSFLSICTDKDKETYQTYRNTNPQVDWDVVYIGADHPLKKDYQVKAIPTYFLIDPSGFLASVPAASPSPDGEYESIDKIFFFIKKAMEPNGAVRVGEP
ncbi:MAG: TlpA disulfide reductase family protein [Crocinitomicaceae bacterium]